MPFKTSAFLPFLCSHLYIISNSQVLSSPTFSLDLIISSVSLNLNLLLSFLSLDWSFESLNLNFVLKIPINVLFVLLLQSSAHGSAGGFPRLFFTISLNLKQELENNSFIRISNIQGQVEASVASPVLTVHHWVQSGWSMYCYSCCQTPRVLEIFIPLRLLPLRSDLIKPACYGRYPLGKVGRCSELNPAEVVKRDYIKCNNFFPESLSSLQRSL